MQHATVLEAACSTTRWGKQIPVTGVDLCAARVRTSFGFALKSFLPLLICFLLGDSSLWREGGGGGRSNLPAKVNAVVNSCLQVTETQFQHSHAALSVCEYTRKCVCACICVHAPTRGQPSAIVVTGWSSPGGSESGGACFVMGGDGLTSCWMDGWVGGGSR